MGCSDVSGEQNEWMTVIAAEVNALRRRIVVWVMWYLPIDDINEDLSSILQLLFL